MDERVTDDYVFWVDNDYETILELMKRLQNDPSLLKLKQHYLYLHNKMHSDNYGAALRQYLKPYYSDGNSIGKYRLKISSNKITSYRKTYYSSSPHRWYPAVKQVISDFLISTGEWL